MTYICCVCVFLFIVHILRIYIHRAAPPTSTASSKLTSTLVTLTLTSTTSSSPPCQPSPVSPASGCSGPAPPPPPAASRPARPREARRRPERASEATMSTTSSCWSTSGPTCLPCPPSKTPSPGTESVTASATFCLWTRGATPSTTGSAQTSGPCFRFGFFVFVFFVFCCFFSLFRALKAVI